MAQIIGPKYSPRHDVGIEPSTSWVNKFKNLGFKASERAKNQHAKQRRLKAQATRIEDVLAEVRRSLKAEKDSSGD